MRVPGGESTLRSSGIFVVHKLHVERTVLPFPGKYADHKGRQGRGGKADLKMLASTTTIGGIKNHYQSWEILLVVCWYQT